MILINHVWLTLSYLADVITRAVISVHWSRVTKTIVFVAFLVHVELALVEVHRDERFDIRVFSN